MYGKSHPGSECIGCKIMILSYQENNPHRFFTIYLTQPMNEKWCGSAPSSSSVLRPKAKKGRIS
uniref:Uncharacterized protein n=1 Tax=Arundo donax TaxID=35708 RepID=A0A0A9BXG7_ARUDO